MPGADPLRFFTQVRYTTIGTFAMPAAALVIGAASYAALRHGALPRWLAIAASVVFLRPEIR